jgi:heme-degrading monooxygenase HmoA
VPHHLAQVNIGRLAAPLDSPRLAGFVEALEPVNALADVAPGFVWRLQTDDGDATALRPYADERMIVNLTVWESLEALRAFVFSDEHRAVMARRREYFERMTEVYLALWWVPAGHVPTVDEAKERLEVLGRTGPSARAFPFHRPFPAPDLVP